jgi:hypothetical protein
MEELTEKYGECEKALSYILTEHHYTIQELPRLQPEFDHLMYELGHANLLDPQNQTEETLMKTRIDNFFRETRDVKRRKTVLKKFAYL